MSYTQRFLKEFNTLKFVLQNAKNILIVGHSRPDPDAVGSTVGFSKFIQKHYKAKTIVGCYDPFPDNLKNIIPFDKVANPRNLDLTKFDVVIGCDSVDRGFNKVIEKISKDCVTVVIDHHHDTLTKGDIFINDGKCSSTCEMLYHFFVFVGKEIDKDIANALLAGIIFDTGGFKHSNTSAQTLAAAADLIKHGASAAKANKVLSENRDVKTLNLWGKALEHTKFFEKTGLAVTAITQEDILKYKIKPGEMSSVASMLTTVPSVRAALVVYQADQNLIKGSLRAEKHGNIDVSAIAHQFGGGGHKLASGFTAPGRIVAQGDGTWKIE